ncbi:MAG: M1 family metallopeptidase [Wenzhouxiangella sp.]|nr:M1 family metallopeptidase [Wenzhouxiangella sp.]MDR9452478.1 M1 family metallopeptidase [Wenzhouxiangella sp.]
MRFKWLPILVAVGLIVGCQDQRSPADVPDQSFDIATGADPHSFAEYDKVAISHMALDLSVDMAAQALEGHVVYDLVRHAPGWQRLVLDTRDLAIDDVHAIRPDGTLLPVSWYLGRSQGHLGQPLVVVLPSGIEQVRIDYASKPEAFGLQWLSAEQTSSGQPFMFSQSQPHYARTWVPLQDTPAVRYTFEATIEAPAELMVVMGAGGNADSTNETGVYTFDMPQPIPSYLMAIAVGDLEFAAIGPRSGVYAEPDWIDRAAEEFDVLEAMIDIGEGLYGPYRWGRYDLLVLPPSFPFGGMENPRLSFLTPTIIAGDGSLLALVAHELAHSWSGNLVTNAAWRDLWLNEGFTVYFEARIMEALYGERVERMLAKLDWDGLMADLPGLDPADQQLARDLSGRDPEEAFIRVPYDKGRFFIDWLEHRFGREALDAFLREYFDAFAFESIDTETFRAYAIEHLFDRYPEAASVEQMDAWLYEPGMPETAIAPQSDAFEQVDQASNQWQSGEIELNALPSETWSVYEWQHFLTGLSGDVDPQSMAAIDQAFALTNTQNVELLYLWLLLSIETQYDPGLDRLESFLVEVGRNKFTRPLYAALADTDWGRDWAIEIYQQAKSGYHPLTRQASERALGIESDIIGPN